MVYDCIEERECLSCSSDSGRGERGDAWRTNHDDACPMIEGMPEDGLDGLKRWLQKG